MEIDIGTICIFGVICCAISMICILFVKEPTLTVTEKGVTESNLVGLFAALFFILGLYNLGFIFNNAVIHTGFQSKSETVAIYEITDVAQHRINAEDNSWDTRVDIHFIKGNDLEHQNLVKEEAVYEQKKIKYLGFFDMVLKMDYTTKTAYVSKEDYETITYVEPFAKYK